MSKKEEITIGIDLGTTNCVSALWENKDLNIIKDRLGNKTIPSVVAFTEKGMLTGYTAKLQLSKNPLNTIYDVKRIIGREFTDETVKNDVNYFTYKIISDDDNTIFIETEYGKKLYRPEEITSLILKKIKYISEQYLKRPVTKAVITIPAYFNDSQRQSTNDAAKIAGLECVRMLNEPTAAALAYGLNKKSNKEMNVIVYDFGGGTLDVSLLNINEGIFRVIATTGNTHLGGEDFDQVIYNYVLDEFNKSYKIPKKIHKRSLQKLRIASENAKILLSSTVTANISITKFYIDKQNGIQIDLNIDITREIFEKISNELFIESLRPVDDIMYITELQNKDIDEILLVGGTTRMPKIRFILHNYFNKLPCTSINPDYVVAAGASIYGYMIDNKDDPFCSNLVLLDILPLSLGVETTDGIMTVIISRNTNIPTKITKRFTTEKNNQTEITINVFEGERKLTKDNYKIGSFVLSGIEEAKHGIPIILVTFEVDVNGIITVSATNKYNNKTSQLVISNKKKLSDTIITQLIKEAQEMEYEDDLKFKLIDKYHQFEYLYDMIDYNINKNPETMLNNDDRKNITNDINFNKQILDDAIKNYSNELCINKQKTNEENTDITDKNIVLVQDVKTQKEKCDDFKNILKLYTSKVKHLKKKYGTLILQLDNDETTIKVKSSSAYQDLSGKIDEYDDINEEKIEIVPVEVDNLAKLFSHQVEDVNINQDDPNMAERKQVIHMCSQVEKYIHSKECDLIEDNKLKLQSYIDNARIWLNVSVKISADDYIRKSTEINNVANQIIHDDKNEKLEKNSIRNDLSELCNDLIDKIDKHDLPIGREQCLFLKKHLIECLSFINDTKDTHDRDDSIYKKKIVEVNSLCEDLYNS
jgi:heat shock 70kDa protein 1/2/6/8